MVSREEVTDALRSVTDPELRKDLVALNMVRDILVDGDKVSFTLNLTTPACPLRSRIEKEAKNAVASVRGVKTVEMKVSAQVAATQQSGQTESLKNVKNIIAVASGKGGVGKSTVAVNLALALAGSGAKVGILDADVYGPNIPLMMGAKERPTVRGDTIVPPVAHGVKVASLGFFYKDETPLVWRGPMVAGAVRQLLTQVEWGDLDYLIADLPPGCLPAGTLVSMADNSLRAIQDIRVGEFVLSYDGEKLVPRRVLGVLPQGRQKVFKLRTPNRTIIATNNHPFLKYTRGRNQWCRLDHLKVKDRIVARGCSDAGKEMTLPDVAHSEAYIEMPRSTTTEFMQIVGHFVGDGFIKRQRVRGEVGLRICEPSGSKFREQYEWLYRKVFKCRLFDDNHGQKFGVASVPLANLFAYLDLDHKAAHKRVPDWVFTLPLQQRLSFITGYAEADGHIRHRESTKSLPDARGMYRVVRLAQNTVALECCNEQLMRQMHELCLMSGLRATNVREEALHDRSLPEGRTLARGRSYSFAFSMKHDPASFKLARVKSIEPMGEMETFDLQVEEHQNFVANSLLVHNTGDSGLTLAQTVPLGGVVIVTTPQEAALSIATKAVGMFRKLNVPILGMVENMSYFVCPHCGERSCIFSTGGGRKAAATLDIQFLGEIPLCTRIREQSDLGVPVVVAAPESPESLAFKEVAFRVAGMVSMVAYSRSQ
jgi:Mrp family chromosome partitioning ATPase